MNKKLTKEETKEYLIKYREQGDQNAAQLLAISNKNLVGYLAKKYLNSGLSFDELVSAGNEGFVRAINKFDYQEKPIEAFSSYIAIAIDNQMKMEIRKYKKHSHVLSFEEPIGHNKDGDEMKVEDLVGTDGEEIIENIITDMKIKVVKEALQSLTSREQQIILLRYGLDEANRKTQNEVAELLGCSKSTIAKQEQKALIKMRHPRNTRKLKGFIEE